MDAAIFYLLAIGLCLSIVSGQLDCPNTVLGANNEISYTVFEPPDAMVYLNVDSPAECYGSVNSLRFCYYPAESTTSGFRTRVGIYRPVGDNYESVAETVLRVVSAPNFTCTEIQLNQNVAIEPGYVVGACVFQRSQGGQNAPEYHRLIGTDAVGFNTSSVPADGCNNDNSMLPSPIVKNSLTANPSSILHLSAIFTPITTPALMTTTPATPMGGTTAGGRENGTTGNGAGGGDAGVAVGVVFALLFVAVLIALIVIVVVVVLRQRQGKLVFHRSTDANIQAIANQIYGTGDKDSSFVGGRGIEESQPYEVPYTMDRNGEASRTHSTKLGSVGAPPTQSSWRGSAAAVPAAYEGMTFGGDVYSTPFDAVRYSELLRKNEEENIYSNVDPFHTPASEEDEIYSQLRSWGIVNLTSSDVKVVGHLGSGQFGSVEQGVWKRQGTRPVDVALKSLTKTSEEDKVKFLQEAAIMAQFRHPNVIMLYGVIAKEEPLMLVVELAKQGDLRGFLLSVREETENSNETKESEAGHEDNKKSKIISSSTPKMFLTFSQQVALGMQYLSGKGFVHRDLAARNVLVTSKNVCKVADFGMSRDLEDESYYVSQGGKIPVKWTSPEAINYKKYSTASDVWAYGCLLYEIWSVGHKPFEGVQNTEVIERVNAGKRLSPPPGTPRMVYELMTLCWHPETVYRPSFRDIVLTLIGSEERVLNIPEEDSSTNPLAGVLGAPLEAGENMYSELQRRYLDYAAKKETDEDYFEVD